MRQYFLKLSGLAVLVLLLQSAVFAQENEDHDTTGNRLRNNDEIIIKRKGDKDTKITIEVKGGQVFINGKPVTEFEDENLSVLQRKIKTFNGEGFSFSGPDDADIVYGPGDRTSVFRNRGGARAYSGNEWNDNSKRAFLGVSSESNDEDDKGTGAKVTQITKSSAAEKTGLKVGDLITKIDETKIERSEDLTRTIRKHKPEDKVTITFKRDGKEQKVTATLGKFKGETYSYSYTMPKMEEFNFKTPMAPMHIEGFGVNSRPRLGIKAQDTEDGKGVKVLDVDEESAAAKAGVKEGDIITRFDGREVNSAMALADFARGSRDKLSIKIGLTRDGKAQEVELKIPRKLRTADL
ncbi:MAG TPA: PDZ domain-containing protein [Puia sp.]|nr:PDZ domain-containing protein [Puia sp.]